MTGASALAANGLARYILGAAFPLFTIQSKPPSINFRSNKVRVLIQAVYNKLGIAWATSLFGFVAIALLPIPWVLFRYGPQIRALSKYDTIKA